MATPSSNKKRSARSPSSSTSVSGLHDKASLNQLQAIVRSSYFSYTQAASAWSQCSGELVQRVQTLSNRWLSLADSADGNWGALSSAAIQDALWREERWRMQKELRAIDDVMSDLTSCYEAMQAASSSLRAAYHADVNNRLAPLSSSSPALSSATLSTPLFSGGTLPLSSFPTLLAELTAMHRRELTLKTALLAHLATVVTADSTSIIPSMRATLEVHLSCWVLEPFLLTARLDEIKRIYESECPQSNTPP